MRAISGEFRARAADRWHDPLYQAQEAREKLLQRGLRGVRSVQSAESGSSGSHDSGANGLDPDGSGEKMSERELARQASQAIAALYSQNEANMTLREQVEMQKIFFYQDALVKMVSRLYATVNAQMIPFEPVPVSANGAYVISRDFASQCGVRLPQDHSQLFTALPMEMVQRCVDALKIKRSSHLALVSNKPKQKNVKQQPSSAAAAAAAAAASKASSISSSSSLSSSPALPDWVQRPASRSQSSQSTVPNHQLPKRDPAGHWLRFLQEHVTPELSRDLDNLNEEQRFVFGHAYDCIHEFVTWCANGWVGPRPRARRILTHGGPGAGKSFLINSILRLQRELGLAIMAVAPMASAASLLIGGMTIHSAIALPGINDGVLPVTPHAGVIDHMNQLFPPTRLAIAVIDEISAVSPFLFVGIHTRLCALTGCHGEPFGGVNVFLFGDFFQFPPVASISLPKAVFNHLIEPVYQQRVKQIRAQAAANAGSILSAAGAASESRPTDVAASVSSAAASSAAAAASPLAAASSDSSRRQRVHVNVHTLRQTQQTLGEDDQARVAAELISSFSKIELVRNMRARDDPHWAAIIKSLRRGPYDPPPSPHMPKLSQLALSKVLTPEKLARQPEFADAMVVVSNNLQRWSIIHTRIRDVARKLGQPLVIFPLPLKGKLSQFLAPDLVQRLRNDYPQLYGIFVRGMSSVFDTNLRNELGLSNGNSHLLHSMCLEPPARGARPGSDGSGFDNGLDDELADFSDLDMDPEQQPDAALWESGLIGPDESPVAASSASSSTSSSSSSAASAAAAAARTSAPPASMQVNATATSPATARDLILAGRPGDVIFLTFTPYTLNVLIPNADVTLFRGLSLSDCQVIIPLTCTQTGELSLPAYVRHRLPTRQSRLGESASKNIKRKGGDSLLKLLYLTFGVEPLLASTSHKAQGKTCRCVVLVMENSPQKPHLTQQAVFVGVSRVPNGENCAVMPAVQYHDADSAGRNPFAHLDDLKPPECLLIFLIGFPPPDAAAGQPTYQLMHWDVNRSLQEYARQQEALLKQKQQHRRRKPNLKQQALPAGNASESGSLSLTSSSSSSAALIEQPSKKRSSASGAAALSGISSDSTMSAAVISTDPSLPATKRSRSRSGSAALQPPVIRAPVNLQIPTSFAALSAAGSAKVQPSQQQQQQQAHNLTFSVVFQRLLYLTFGGDPRALAGDSVTSALFRSWPSLKDMPPDLAFLSYPDTVALLNNLYKQAGIFEPVRRQFQLGVHPSAYVKAAFQECLLGSFVNMDQLQTLPDCLRWATTFCGFVQSLPEDVQAQVECANMSINIATERWFQRMIDNPSRVASSSPSAIVHSSSFSSSSSSPSSSSSLSWSSSPSSLSLSSSSSSSSSSSFASLQTSEPFSSSSPTAAWCISTFISAELNVRARESVVLIRRMSPAECQNVALALNMCDRLDKLEHFRSKPLVRTPLYVEVSDLASLCPGQWLTGFVLNACIQIFISKHDASKRILFINTTMTAAMFPWLGGCSGGYFHPTRLVEQQFPSSAGHADFLEADMILPLHINFNHFVLVTVLMDSVAEASLSDCESSSSSSSGSSSAIASTGRLLDHVRYQLWMADSIPGYKCVSQAIWHQVSRAVQLFVEHEYRRRGITVRRFQWIERFPHSMLQLGLPPQRDGFNCGLHVIMAAEAVIRHRKLQVPNLDRDYQSADMPALRLYLAFELLSRAFHSRADVVSSLSSSAASPQAGSASASIQAVLHQLQEWLRPS